MEGPVADKSEQLIVTALSRAAAAAGAVPLHGSKAVPGLFPANAAGKQAAQHCQDEGYLTLAPEDPPDAPEASAKGSKAGAGAGTATLTRKKAATQALCSITDKGLAYLLNQVSPREVLEEFVRSLETRRAEWGELNTLARRLLESTETLKAHVAKVLDQFPRLEGAGATGSLKALFRDFLAESLPAVSPNGTPAADTWLPLLLEELGRWQGTGSCEDCPLPDLFRKVKAHTPGVTVGQFHDALRRLHQEGKVYLHPWTGPLYDLPEPPYALLVGHEVAYYASVRK
jgi:hypothetical protein